MSWGRIDDRLAEHPKWVRLEREHGPRAWADGLAVWTWALCYACRNETDGGIDATVLARATPLGRAAIKAADALVAVGLMDREGPLYMLHDYTEYNPSREELQAKRRADSERKRCKPSPDSDRIPIGIASDSATLPALPPRTGAGARVRDPLPSPPVPTPALPIGSARDARAPDPDSPTVDTRTAERARALIVAAYREHAPAVPRRVIALTGRPGDTAAMAGVSLDALPGILRRFFADRDMRAKGWPVGHLLANPSQWSETATGWQRDEGAPRERPAEQEYPPWALAEREATDG